MTPPKFGQPGDGGARPLAGGVVATLVALNLLLLFFLIPHMIEGDGLVRFNALRDWLAGHGVPNTRYPLIGSLPSVLLIWLGDLLGSVQWWVSRYNVLVYAAGLGGLYALLRGHLPADLLGAWLLLLGTTAMLPNALTGFGAETFAAMAIATGLAALAVGHWKTATVLLGIGAANQPATLVGLALAMAWWAGRKKQLRALAPLVVAAGLVLLDNLLRRRSLLVSGYEGNHGYQTALPYSGLPGFSYPILFGVLSLLLSFGKGLLFFTPGLFLPFGRALDALRPVREAFALWLLFLGGTLLVYGGWWGWYGGFSWGPRFLVFASVPASLLLAAHARRPPRSAIPATIVVVALALSVWVGIDGATFGQFAQSTCTENRYYLEAFCWYVPEYSVLWTPFVFRASLSLPDLVVIAFATGVAGYVAWPLLTAWAVAVRAEGGRALATLRNRGGWRF